MRIELAGLSFIDNAQLVQLEFLALYLNTDTTSLGDLSHDEFVGKCSEYVRNIYALVFGTISSYLTQVLNHEVLGSQFILKPVHSHGTVSIRSHPSDAHAKWLTSIQRSLSTLPKSAMTIVRDSIFNCSLTTSSYP